MEIAEEIPERCHWEAWLGEGARLPFQQSWAYGHAAAALGARVRRVLVADAGRPIALAQMLERPGLRLISRGPVWLGPAEPARQVAVLRLLARGSLAVATPETPVSGFGLVPLVTGRFHAIWDLRPEPDVLRAGLDRKWAGHLAACERRAVCVRQDGLRSLPALVRAEVAQRRAKGYRNLPPGFTMALPRESLRVWHWSSAEEPGAAMALVRHGIWASYHLAWAGPDARQSAVHQAMLWQAALALRAEGVRWLDLGGVDSERAPGLARFKLGTGANLVQLGATAWVLPQWRGHERRSRAG